MGTELGAWPMPRRVPRGFGSLGGKAQDPKPESRAAAGRGSGGGADGRTDWRPSMAPVGLGVAAASFAAFRGLHRGLELLPALQLADARDRWTWRNVCASLVHSLLAGTGALLWMSQYSHLISDFTPSCPPRTVSLVSLSVGYFLADAVDILWNQTFDRSWHLLCHHAMAVSCLVMAVLPGHCLSVSVVPLLLEVNSACLHARTLLLLSGQTATLVYCLVCWATLATLLVFRLLPLGGMSLQLLCQHHQFPLTFSVLWGVGLFTITIMSIMLVMDLMVGNGLWVQATSSFSRKIKAKCNWECGSDDCARLPYRAKLQD